MADAASLLLLRSAAWFVECFYCGENTATPWARVRPLIGRTVGSNVSLRVPSAATLRVWMALAEALEVALARFPPGETRAHPVGRQRLG
jgi:hypothetical protein